MVLSVSPYVIRIPACAGSLDSSDLIAVKVMRAKKEQTER